MACKITDLVRRTYPTLSEGVSVTAAARLMAERDLGSVMVEREGRVVGVFSERDLLKRVVALGRDPGSVPLSEVSTYHLVSIPHDSDCRSAVRAMQSSRVRRLLVYRGNQYLGIVKLRELAGAMAARSTASDLLVNTVGAITAAVAVGVIAMLLFQLPDMFQIAGIDMH